MGSGRSAATREHFLYSKLMCWAALDRAVSTVPTVSGVDDRVDVVGADARRDPATRCCARDGATGPTRSPSTSARDDLDASNLMMPHRRVPSRRRPADPRHYRCHRAAPHRRRTAWSTATARDDGLAGEEGTFLLCTFWLAQALAMAGRPNGLGRSSNVPPRFVNDVGLLAEEVDPATGELLGNFPQAFSHIGLINAAWTISQQAPIDMGQRVPRNGMPRARELQ